MRSLLAILACLMLVVTASGAAQAAGLGCSETVGEVAVHMAGDCDEVPADSDKYYRTAIPAATASPLRPRYRFAPSCRSPTFPATMRRRLG